VAALALVPIAPTCVPVAACKLRAATAGTGGRIVAVVAREQPGQAQGPAPTEVLLDGGSALR
jgi:hypothetical protein